MRVEPSWRQPAGIGLILLLIIGWAVLIVSDSSLLDGLPRWVQIFYYLFGGLVWIAPLRPLLGWMETGRWLVRRSRHGSESRDVGRVR